MYNASHFFSLLQVITSFRNMEKKRTEEDWRNLHERIACAILNGRCANEYFGNMSMESLIDDAIWGSDDFVEKLRKREEKQ